MAARSRLVSASSSGSCRRQPLRLFYNWSRARKDLGAQGVLSKLRCQNAAAMNIPLTRVRGKTRYARGGERKRADGATPAAAEHDGATGCAWVITDAGEHAADKFRSRGWQGATL